MADRRVPFAQVRLARWASVADNHGREARMFSTKVKIGLLVVAHVVGILALAWLTKSARDPEIAWLFFATLGQVQIGLLATWAGLGTVTWPWRLLGTMIGAGWLIGVSVAVGQNGVFSYWQSPWPVCFLVILPLLIILAVLAPVRRSGLTLCLPSSSDTVVAGAQFSIRNVLMLTAAVAIVLCVYNATGRTDNQQLALFSIRHLPMTLAAVWATVMTRLSVWRFIVVASCWILFGCFLDPVVAIIHFWENDVWRKIPTTRFVILPIATFMHTTVLLASLLVIRACGYRLIRSATEG